MLIAKAMAAMYPDRIAGLHLANPVPTLTPSVLAKFALAKFAPSLVLDDPVNDVPLLPTIDGLKAAMQEMGYAHIQTTKPDTVRNAVI